MCCKLKATSGNFRATSVINREFFEALKSRWIIGLLCFQQDGCLSVLSVCLLVWLAEASRRPLKCFFRPLLFTFKFFI
jgi:hypothetical protein